MAQKDASQHYAEKHPFSARFYFSGGA